MKAKTFENLIRKIIREEIDYALRREIKSLKEDLRDGIKPQIIENNEYLNEEPSFDRNSLKEKIMGTTPIKKQKETPFTKNQTLNDLLNETAQGDTSLDGNISPASLNENFDVIGDMPMESAPPEVVNAVTRDYSDLMKAIDKKKNNRP